MQQTTPTGQGFLRVSVRAGRDAIPIPDALVLIHDDDRAGDSTDVLFSLRTDENGRTEAVPLPAPAASLSLTPGDLAPYGRYNVTVQKEGYGAVENVGVPVFDGVVSTQPVVLIPLTEFEPSPAGERRVFPSPTGENPLL
ncbi:MAG: carboxypeptidase regulatory-like domain-containing protein [Clostridia bacterium]|nr:carboxypeptidase regulatory-like domain-containing protein [Clostridia bacterium]